MKVTEERRREWRERALMDQVAGFGLGWPAVVLALLDDDEGWASYAAEQERHAETAARLELVTREARLSREATEKAVRSRIARHELERAFRAAGAPEDSMATDDDLLRHEGRAEAVAIMQNMLGCPSGWHGPWRDGKCVDCGEERN